MSSVISEPEFYARLRVVLLSVDRSDRKCVTGPGRSGAIASVYASHLLGIPWIVSASFVPADLKPALVIDTAAKTGRTIRRCARLAGLDEADHVVLWQEPPRVRFWYESEAQTEDQREQRLRYQDKGGDPYEFVLRDGEHAHRELDRLGVARCAGDEEPSLDYRGLEYGLYGRVERLARAYETLSRHHEQRHGCDMGPSILHPEADPDYGF